MLDYILNASKNRDCIIIYLTDHEITRRMIHIIELSEKYVKAYCYLRKSVRNFKRDAILSAALVKSPGTFNSKKHA